MLSLAEAFETILADVEPLGPVVVPLRKALGRVLEEDAVSETTMPPWDNASMDGFAVYADDIAGASESNPIALPVVESVAAGDLPSAPLERGTAVRITTGAPIPAGTDSVVRVEDTDADEESDRPTVRVRATRDAGKNIRRAGEDIEIGDLVVEAGSTLGAAHLGVLASIGLASVEVHGAPRVALFHSGNELVEVDAFAEVQGGEKIVSSNSYTLPAIIEAAGGTVLDLGIARDTAEDLARRFEIAKQADLIVTTGGMALGGADYTRAVLSQVGGELRFWKIRARPGSQMAYGTVGGVPWLGLPGNPVSAFLCGELFVRAVIRKMAGHEAPHRMPVEIVLLDDAETPGKVAHLLRVHASHGRGGTITAHLAGPQGSAMLKSASAANAIVVVPEERDSVQAGDVLRGFLLNDELGHTEQWMLA